MLEIVLWLVAIIVFPILYILFSDIKPYKWQEECQDSLCKTNLRDDDSSEEIVFKH